MERLSLDIDQLIGELWGIYISSGKPNPLLKSDIEEVLGQKIIKKLVSMDLLKVEYLSFLNAQGKNTGIKCCLLFTDKGEKYCEEFYGVRHIVL